MITYIGGLVLVPYNYTKRLLTGTNPMLFICNVTWMILFT